MSGYFVQTVKKPNCHSVKEYDNMLKYSAPNKKAELITRQKEIQCTCCGQEAPSAAGALLKVEDKTPFTKKFKFTEKGHNNEIGETIWLCADCYTFGVRPTHVYFGDIKWNQEGLKVQNRKSEFQDHPW